MPYVLVSPDDDIIKEESTIDTTVATKPGFRWLPIENNGAPGYDPTTHYVSGPINDILEDRVVRRWEIIEKTPEVLNNERENKLSAVDLVVFKILFRQENRLRVLEGKPEITVEQFRTAVKSLI
jgi:hypothetical protein